MIVVTPGEPAGIGPDLIIQWAQNKRSIPVEVVCDADMLARRSSELGLNLLVKSHLNAPTLEAGKVTVRDVPLVNLPIAGTLDSENSGAVLQALDLAIDGCLNGEYEALVTGPIQKSAIQESGISFTGHTEYLADKCDVDSVVMMLASKEMRVALATTHIPLSRVALTINKKMLEKKLRLVFKSLTQTFSISDPKVAVSGLNPHAGESGHLGLEEVEIIEPVCSKLRGEGFRVEGPLPADTLFGRRGEHAPDAFFVMYHDQGLPVLKYASFGNAVNITLGLPFIRTSVDHGTALDIAASGSADVGSFASALEMASDMCIKPTDEI